MKKFVLLILAFLCATQVEAGTISRPSKTFGGNSFNNGVIPDASDFNGDHDTIYSEFNGNISNANIASNAAISGSKIDPSFSTTSSVSAAAPCHYFDESDQSADARRWYICVSSGTLSIATYTDAGGLQNTWFSVNRSTGQIHLEGSSPFEFEGATADAFETLFQITDPTADRTITFPNASITVNAIANLSGLSDDAIPVGDSATAATARTIPNCTDSGGNHLNYTQSSNSFSCGTSAPSPTAPVFSRVLATSGDITTTSTSFTDLTGMTVTFTTGAFPVVYGLSGSTRHSDANGDWSFDIDIDGTRQSTAVLGLVQLQNDGTAVSKDISIGLTGQSAALSAASHTIKVQWLVNGGTGTVKAASPAALFWAHEIR